MSINIVKLIHPDISPVPARPQARAVYGNPLATHHEFAWLLSEPEERKSSFSVGDDVAPYKF